MSEARLIYTQGTSPGAHKHTRTHTISTPQLRPQVFQQWQSSACDPCVAVAPPHAAKAFAHLVGPTPLVHGRMLAEVLLGFKGIELHEGQAADRPNKGQVNWLQAHSSGQPVKQPQAQACQGLGDASLLDGQASGCPGI